LQAAATVVLLSAASQHVGSTAIFTSLGLRRFPLLTAFLSKLHQWRLYSSNREFDKILDRV